MNTYGVGDRIDLAVGLGVRTAATAIEAEKSSGNWVSLTPDEQKQVCEALVDAAHLLDRLDEAAEASRTR